MTYPGFDTRPREGHLRVLAVPGSISHPGEYVSKTLYLSSATHAVLATVDSVTDALKVRISPARNPGVVEVLNSPVPEFRFLGVALNRLPSNVDFLHGDWGAVTLISDPNASPITSVFQTQGAIKGTGWFVGSGGELAFHWDHTDKFVYCMRHTVEYPSGGRPLYNVANFSGYVDYYFKDHPEKYTEVKIFFEPLDQEGL